MLRGESVRQVVAFLSSAFSRSSSSSCGGGGGAVAVAVATTEVYCCVCISACCDGDETRILPCGHVFHRNCVDLWLARYQRSCPLCRMHVGGDAVGLVHEQQQQQLSEDLVIWVSSLFIAGL